MFGQYALPSDDLAATAVTVTASAEDVEYPALNLIAPTNTGHLNLPSRPAKLTTYSGYWELTFASPITAQMIALIYHNFDAGLNVTLIPGAGTPIALTIPSRWENGWWPSPWQTFTPTAATTWRISINAGNSVLPQIGRVILLGSGGLRQLAKDVRWGVEEIEEQGQIEQATEAGVETLYELFGPRRSFVGEFGLENTEASILLTLYRSARNRILPWLLIPDSAVNDAWFVRFSEPRWARTRETYGFNTFPFRVTELSRGLPWP